jgi:short-subunit dehydrogenase
MKSNSKISSSKVVLITGSSSGIGRSAVNQFSENGWVVIASMRSPEKESELQNLKNVVVIKLDVTDEVSINQAINSIKQTYGRIDVLVNNAGYGLMGAFEDSSSEKIEKQFKTNVFGLMNVTRAVLPMMRQQNKGKVINVSSIGGKLGIPLYSSYHATKFAIEGFTESLRFELKPFGIDVALIEPGAISTNFLSSSADISKPDESSPYKEYFSRVYNSYVKTSQSASSPDVVAKKILKVALSNKPSLRHPVGGGAELMMPMRKILPDCAVETLVKQQTQG